MSKSIFSKIIDRELPAHFIYEDDDVVAILDRFPTVKGQTVIIPKKEVDYAFDLDDDTYLHMFKVAKTVGKALDKAMDAERTCLVVEGFDVPHVHIKIYPIRKEDKPLGDKLAMGEEASDDDLAIVATQIQAALEDDD